MHIKLPDHVDAAAVEKLIAVLAYTLRGEAIDGSVAVYLDACNLQPTSRAALLAAEAAVAVLVAHEIGQEVGT